MIILNPSIIQKTGGLYNVNADQNQDRLTSIMKNIIIKERPQQSHATVWATDLDERTSGAQARRESGLSELSPRVYDLEHRSSATPSLLDKTIKKTNASTQTSGGRVWAYPSNKKKAPAVKTFAL